MIEYEDCFVSFEGEYINGKRNGKGKEYSILGYYGVYSKEDIFSKLAFNGEYLNGKKWNGKWKEYHDDGKIRFDGEYVNGEINGKAKEYNTAGNLEFSGEYYNGKRWNGKFNEFNFDNTIKYRGEYIDGDEYVLMRKSYFTECLLTY